MSKKIKLADISTSPKEKITKEEALEASKKLSRELAEIQNKLYAQKKYDVLIILQGMDASGKDSAVKHVFSGVNPAGCRVKSFKAPTEEELAHHFLWRISKECPEKGMIQIFNRSQYEDILVPTVEKLADDKLIKARCEEINCFEAGLVRNNTILMKFYLHISHDKQVEKLQERKTNEYKRWKYQKEDIAAISKHDEFAKVYEDIFDRCSEAAPWKIIPADKKWYKNYAILNEIVQELEKYEIHFPKVDL
ncbi:PPK2 family polyphosphate kinase [Mucilaginibacter arboris]|nr:PPK2 family polyphosphate kinase [Mucilaginibacter arboris]